METKAFPPTKKGQLIDVSKIRERKKEGGKEKETMGETKGEGGRGVEKEREKR